MTITELLRRGKHERIGKSLHSIVSQLSLVNEKSKKFKEKLVKNDFW